MKKTKYHFNRETLSFHLVEVSIKDRFKKLSVHLSISFVLGIVFFIFAWYNFDSPAIRIIRSENANLHMQYDFLNQRIERAFKVLDDIHKRDNEQYRSFFEAKPIPTSVIKAGFGGSNKYSKYNNFISSNLLAETAKKIDILSKQVCVQSTSFDEIINLIYEKENMLLCLPSIPPIRKKDITAFGPFGMRYHEFLMVMQMHNGVDLCANEGVPIYATGNAFVARASSQYSLGNFVILNHGYGYETIYGHVSKILVTPGQKVKRGDVIALVGSTGISGVNHVHYEVHKFGTALDPVNFFYADLNEEEFQKIVEWSKKNTKVSF